VAMAGEKFTEMKVRGKGKSEISKSKLGLFIIGVVKGLDLRAQHGSKRFPTVTSHGRGEGGRGVL